MAWQRSAKMAQRRSPAEPELGGSVMRTASLQGLCQRLAEPSTSSHHADVALEALSRGCSTKKLDERMLGQILVATTAEHDACAYACACACMHACACACRLTCAYACRNACAWSYACAYACLKACACLNACAYAWKPSLCSQLERLCSQLVLVLGAQLGAQLVLVLVRLVLALV